MEADTYATLLSLPRRRKIPRDYQLAQLSTPNRIFTKAMTIEISSGPPFFKKRYLATSLPTRVTTATAVKVTLMIMTGKPRDDIMLKQIGSHSTFQGAVDHTTQSIDRREADFKWFLVPLLHR